MLPYHTVSADSLVVDGTVAVSGLLAGLQPANLAVLGYLPNTSLLAHPLTKAKYEALITSVTHPSIKMLAECLKPTICEAATVGKPESRAVFVDSVLQHWARHMGTAAIDPTSCNLGRVSNMLCLAINPVVATIGGAVHVLSPAMELGGDL